MSLTQNQIVPLIPISQATVLLAGTARNVAQYISTEMKHLLSAVQDFKKVFVLIIESDSSDSTIEVLQNLKEQIPNFDYLALGNLSEKIPLRTARIAHCRNHIISSVKNDPKYASVDFVILADLDGINTHIKKSSIADCWKKETPHWDVVTANQLDFYYDIFALRHKYWSPYDCVEQQNNLEKIMGYDQSVNLAVWSKQVKLPIMGGYIEVDSAFGGFAIYKKQAYISSTYTGGEVGQINGNEICEHVSHCEGMRNAGYRIYINCALINCKRPTDQNPQKAKTFSTLMTSVIRNLGVGMFGKKRFRKYLNLLAE
ncbi:glycosyltransferase family A protein [Polynucleobacter sp. AP-Kaivos-20-H2]|uniref:glycosyltransferase family A protein n=1 Tax=Polynucleobacter sp. AP-Kaivos-20-H2 TaxID=2689104 RepID=UPI001C0B3ADB|nr:glycosyltransferase family A protein [Polynucleobacter sp. AP-Kaivos-20-H2]MBU3604748.1 glycosyltransferase family 2 protein [Polynucleobacter sp. AP-Kaivos-20-H2]